MGLRAQGGCVEASFKWREVLDCFVARQTQQELTSVFDRSKEVATPGEGSYLTVWKWLPSGELLPRIRRDGIVTRVLAIPGSYHTMFIQWASLLIPCEHRD